MNKSGISDDHARKAGLPLKLRYPVSIYMFFSSGFLVCENQPALYSINKKYRYKQAPAELEKDAKYAFELESTVYCQLFTVD